MVEAKRGPPKEVEPAIYNDIKYTAPLDKMGYVEAFNNTTGEKFREIKVYDVKIVPNLEADVQDIFITNLSIVNGKLIVISEAGVIYDIDIPDSLKVNRTPPAPRPPKENGKIMDLETPYLVGFLVLLIAMAVGATLFVKWKKTK